VEVVEPLGMVHLELELEQEQEVLDLLLQV